MRHARLVSAVMLGLLGPHEFAAAQTTHFQPKWPIIFAPETDTGFEKAKPPSDAVLDALLRTPEAVRRGDDNNPDREYIRKSFQVVRVDLGGTNEEDYVVLGVGYYTGADCHWFWIVRVKQGNGQVLLYTPGLVIEILRQETNGYHDIRESWGGNSGSTTRIFQYTGTTYKLASEHSEGPPQ